jgi:hypothetical protein
MIALLPQWFWFPLAAAVGLAVLSMASRRPTFGLLAALFVLGSAAQFALTEPNWYPELRLSPKTATDLAMWGLLALEAVAAGFVLLRTGPARLVTRARASLGLWRVLAVLAITAALSVSIMGHLIEGTLVSYAVNLAAGGALAALHVAALVAAGISERPAWFRLPLLPPLANAVIATAIALALGQWGFQHLARVEDELAYLFQAATFAEGALWSPPPPGAALAGIEHYLLDIGNGRWFSTTAPGWPAALAVGQAVGAPWLVNPVLAGVAVFFGQVVAARRAGERTGRIVGLLMATSPWLAAAGGSFMTHSLTLALVLFAWWAIGLPQRRSSALAVLSAGLAMGWVFATRPLDGLIVGGLTGLWLIARKGPGRISQAIVYALGCIGAGGTYLAYNFAMTGDPLLSPLSQYLAKIWNSDANDYGFGANIGPPGGWNNLDYAHGHSVTEAVINTANNLASLHLELFGWATGSLGLVAAAYLWLRRVPFDKAMMALAVVTVLAMSAYWFAGSFYIGPRYWFLVAFPMVYLTARGFSGLEARLGGERSGGAAAALALVCLTSVAVFLPWRAEEKYQSFGRMHLKVADAYAEGRFGTDVVIVRGEDTDRAAALMLNDPWLPEDRPVFLWDVPGLDREALQAAFPGRKISEFDADRE